MTLNTMVMRCESMMNLHRMSIAHSVSSVSFRNGDNQKGIRSKRFAIALTILSTIAAFAIWPQNRTDTDSVLSLKEVTDISSCVVRVGRGNAFWVATLLVPDGDGTSRYKVLDAGGTLFDGVLPFNAHVAHLGKSDSGSVLAGFGDIVLLHSLERRPESAPSPVSFFLDGELLYTTEKAVDFRVAQDASAFFTLEPQLDGSHTLRIQSLHPYSKREFTLDMPLHLPQLLYTAYRGRFSSDFSDVMLLPGDSSRPMRFYPVRNGEPVELWRDQGDRNSLRTRRRAEFLNRYTAYYWDIDGSYDESRPTVLVRKMRFSWEGHDAKEVVVWERQIDSDYYGSILIAHNKKHIVFTGRGLRVLDSETGKLAFAYPTDIPYWKSPQFAGRHPREIANSESASYKGAKARERLASVEYSDETAYPSYVSSYWVIGNELVAKNSIQRGGNVDCRMVSIESMNQCVNSAKERHGVRRTYVYDVFALDGIHMESQAIRRVPANMTIGCRGGALALDGLKFEEGRLRYLPSSDH